MGLCSMSTMKKSSPARAITSTTIGLPVKCIIPITTSPRSSLRRTWLFIAPPSWPLVSPYTGCAAGTGHMEDLSVD